MRDVLERDIPKGHRHDLFNRARNRKHAATDALKGLSMLSDDGGREHRPC